MKSAQKSARVTDHPQEQIKQLCREAITKLDHDGVGIGTNDVARWVMRKIDPTHRTSAVVYYCAQQGISQIARPILRDELDLPDDPDNKQIEAFSNHLQERYSVKRPNENGELEEKYFPRNEISKEEIDSQVIPMLEKRRDAYQKHLDMLRAWNQSRSHKANP